MKGNIWWYDNTQKINEQLEAIWNIVSNPGQLFVMAWNWTMPRLYWITAISCVIFIIYYVGTRSKKCLRIVIFILITYALLKGIDAVI